MEHPKLEIVKHIYDRPTVMQAIDKVVEDALRAETARHMKENPKKVPQLCLADECKSMERMVAKTIVDFKETREAQMKHAAES